MPIAYARPARPRRQSSQSYSGLPEACARHRKICLFICTGDRQICSYFRNSSGTLPPFSASFTMTCLWSQIFIDAEIVLVAGKMKLLGELLARRKARIEIEQLHQIDDRMPPVELLLVARGKLVEN